MTLSRSNSLADGLDDSLVSTIYILIYNTTSCISQIVFMDASKQNASNSHISDKPSFTMIVQQMEIYHD